MGTENNILQKIRNESPDVLFETFTEQLVTYRETGELPPLAGPQVENILQLQADRLRKMNVELEYEMKRRWGESPLFFAKESWEEDGYHNELHCHSVRLKTSVLENGQTVYKRIKNKMLYETIAYPDRKKREQNKEEAFPSITNYCFMDEVAGDQGEFETEVKPYVTCCGTAVGIFFFVECLKVGPLPASAFWGIMMGLVSGVPAGYILFGLVRLVKLLIRTVWSAATRTNGTDDRKYFLQLMKENNPEFSFEYFIERAVFLLRQILFSENPEKLTFYKGEPLPEAAGMIEAAYAGATEIRSCRKEDGIISVTAEIFMIDLYWQEKKVQKKRNRFRMELVISPENNDWVVNSCIMLK